MMFGQQRKKSRVFHLCFTEKKKENTKEEEKKRDKEEKPRRKETTYFKGNRTRLSE